VVMPAGRLASRGVRLLAAGGEVGAAWAATTTADEGNQIANRPMSWRYLVEERLRGPEFSTECLVAGGRVVFLNVTAKRTSAGPAPVELGHVVPAEPPAEWRGPVDDLVRAVGFDTGILHAEWVRTADGPRLVECAGRPPGDKIVDLIDLAYRTNLTRHWVDALAGRPVDPPATASRAAAIAFVTADPGTVLAVDGVEDASALPGVERVDVLRKAGDTLADLRSSWDRVGSAIAVGDTPAEADARARAAVAAVRVEVRTER
ncbi:ATP-grasp domain-containing protein, partial [Saccharothrix sp. MB29]|nr:ATP-grasp domain-containing protein [Saccharothrix sp. MB29]